jgi:hypothetical protein
MDDPGFQDTDFVVAWCATCAREVLTCLGDDAEREPRRCVHCDQPIAGGFRLATGTELATEGYHEIDPPAGCGAAACGGGSCRRS